jgi:hypothetical protein
MKEADILRWFFGIAGFSGLYSGATNLWSVAARAIPFTSAPVISLILGAGYAYFTYTLPVYLHSRRVWVLKSFVSIAVVLFIAPSVITTVSLGMYGLEGLILSLSLGLAVWWYQYQTITTLSKRK